MKSTEFYRYIASSFPIIWIDTHEYERAIAQLKFDVQTKLSKITKVPFKFFSWDTDTGIVNHKTGMKLQKTALPNQAVDFIRTKNDDDKLNILFAKDFHHYIGKQQIWRALLNGIPQMRKGGNSLVIVSPIINIPTEIEKYVTVLDFKLPNREQLMEYVNKFEKDFERLHIKHLTIEEKEAIVEHGVGLTSMEFENALSLGISNPSADKAQIIYEQKKQLIIKTGLLKIHQTSDTFETLAGMENMKKFTKGMINSKLGRGVLIVGIQGGGKSEFAKRLGNETSRPVICLDFGDLMGGVVGKTEEKTKMALKTVDAMEPAILFIDEFEKGLAGVSGYSGDSGVSKRQGQKFLTWLSDHETDVFVVATANDISKIPAEYLRAERWDTIFFVDFPTEAQAKAIFEVYKNKYGLDEDLPQYILKDWTGAEIKSLCRMSRALKIPLAEAKEYITNIMNVDSDKIRELQEWAKHKTIPASKNISHNNNDDPERQIIISEGE